MDAQDSVHCNWVLSINEESEVTFELPHRLDLRPDPIREHRHVSSVTGVVMVSPN